MENSKDFMAPKFNYYFLTFVIVFLSFVHSLEYLADVSHVKYIVRFCWCR